jgi:glycosyltransferase involved in cell wall biosynthesis
VSHWLDGEYNDIPVVSIKDDKVELKIDDVLVVPEYYSNVLQQLASVKCVKVMLIQQKDYIFDTLPVGSRWSDYGFDKAITTTEASKKYILEYFPEAIVHIIPPIIGEHFKPSEKPLKPYIAISCRDRVVHRKIISEFYLKHPQLRWLTFRDMVQLSYDEFAGALNECLVSVWVDDESTFGTFPLESMASGVPVIGKVPNIQPEWMNDDNGVWLTNKNLICDFIADYIQNWLEDNIKTELYDNMKKTVETYTNKQEFDSTVVSLFENYLNVRAESFEQQISKTEE